MFELSARCRSRPSARSWPSVPSRDRRSLTYCPPKPPPPTVGKSKCNSGNGNGSEAITFVEGEHCFGGDPGNSFNAGNRGGDEIPTAGGVPNPGGNNVD